LEGAYQQKAFETIHANDFVLKAAKDIHHPNLDLS
jgi:hypothetical protein